MKRKFNGGLGGIKQTVQGYSKKNTATHCDCCGDPLTDDHYERSPKTGALSKTKAWCPLCYEALSALDQFSRCEANPYYQNEAY